MLSRACTPTAGSDSSERSSSAPLPMKVGQAGMPACSQSARSSPAAPARIVPLPVRITGAARARTIAAASRTAASSGCGGRGRAVGERVRRGGQLGGGDRLGQLQVGRPGPLGLGQLEGLPDDLGDGLGSLDARVPLCDRAEHVDDVDVLVALLVDQVEAHLAGDRDHRGVVEVRVGDAGDQVGRPRAQRAEADAGPAREPPVDVGHERRPLLVAHDHDLDRRAAQRLHDLEGLLPGDGEDALDALRLEAPHHQLGGLQEQPPC